MARVTVEDCVGKIPNRFELILIAAQRARELAAGSKPVVERDNDKNPVVALREIAEDGVDLPRLREAIVRGLQKTAEQETPSEEVAEMMRQEQLLATQNAALGRGGDGMGEDVGDASEDGDDDEEDDDAADQTIDDEQAE